MTFKEAFKATHGSEAAISACVGLGLTLMGLFNSQSVLDGYQVAGTIAAVSTGLTFGAMRGAAAGVTSGREACRGCSRCSLGAALSGTTAAGAALFGAAP